MGINFRIKEERLRVGLSQTELADAILTTRRSLVNWETEAAQPPAIAVAAMAKCGMDVLYILTGQRSVPVAPQALLPEGDRILLDNFHAAPPGVQVGVKTTLGAFAPVGSSTAKKRRA